jgi:hypothetical protein
MEFQQSLPIHSKLTNFLQEATDCEESGAGVFSMSLKLSSGSYGFF